MKKILQIVPRFPDGLDGVADYAVTLAKKLRSRFGNETVFAVPNEFMAKRERKNASVAGFNVVALEHLLECEVPGVDQIIMHYVNYGYQKRGVPFRLVATLRRLRKEYPGKLLTIFHELYASGSPLSSAFWLQPVQIYLTKSIARLSDECIVNNEDFSSELLRWVPHARIQVHPTPSGLQEPSLTRTQISDRNPHQWVIVGGTLLAERSLRSFAEVVKRIPESIAPQKLFVLGGNDNPSTHTILANLDVRSDYRPGIAASEASDILSSCAFAWINYFHRPDVETSIILKSSAFAAACAHAVVPIFPHRGGPIALAGEKMPGPFFVAADDVMVPTDANRTEIADKIYNWYQRNATSDRLVEGVSRALGLERS